MDCELARAFALYGGTLRLLGIREVVVGGIYHHRRARLRGRSQPMLSRHALGLGIDIRAFITDDGKVLRIKTHYRHPTVQRVEAMLNALDGFRAVVTPGNDRAHKSHFHLSAKMTIDESQPDLAVDVATLLGTVGAERRGWSDARKRKRARRRQRAAEATR